MKYDGEADEGIGLTTDEPVVGPALQRPQGWQQRGPMAGHVPAGPCQEARRFAS